MEQKAPRIAVFASVLAVLSSLMLLVNAFAGKYPGHAGERVLLLPLFERLFLDGTASYWGQTSWSLQETIWGSFFGRRHLGAVRSVGMPFSIIFGAIAVPGAALWGEMTGDLSAPFMATAVCWFIGAILVLFIPKPKKKYSEGSPEFPDITTREEHSQLVDESLLLETPKQSSSPRRRSAE